MSKILKTHCIFEYYTPENLWFMNFNNTPLIPSANHSPKYLLMETCDRFCFAFILAYSRICKGKHAHIRYMYMHTHTHETICYKTVLEELFQTTHWQQTKFSSLAEGKSVCIKVQQNLIIMYNFERSEARTSENPRLLSAAVMKHWPRRERKSLFCLHFQVRVHP